METELLSVTKYTVRVYLDVEQLPRVYYCADSRVCRRTQDRQLLWPTAIKHAYGNYDQKGGFGTAPPLHSSCIFVLVLVEILQ